MWIMHLVHVACQHPLCLSHKNMLQWRTAKHLCVCCCLVVIRKGVRFLLTVHHLGSTFCAIVVNLGEFAQVSDIVKSPAPFWWLRLHQHRLVHFVMLRYTSVLAKSGDKIQDLSPRDAIMTLMHPHYLSIKICCSDGWQNICASMAAEMWYAKVFGFFLHCIIFGYLLCAMFVNLG